MSTYTFFDFKDYFNIPSRLDEWLNPYSLYCEHKRENKKLAVLMTERAKRQLEKNSEDLFIELQLLYSCILKKRVVFHTKSAFNYIQVSNKLNICFRKIQPTNCDPQEFGTGYPEKRELNTTAIENIQPKILRLDFKNNQWTGNFDL